jgi:hypothetical protein
MFPDFGPAVNPGGSGESGLGATRFASAGIPFESSCLAISDRGLALAPRGAVVN